MTGDRSPSTALTAGVVAIGGMGAAVALVYATLTSHGNSLAELMKFVAAGAFVAGFVNPRATMLLFIVVTGYLDLLKRLLILYDMPTIMDLFYVLGIAPLMLAGITLGTLVAGFWGKIDLDRRHYRLLWIAGGFILITAVFAFRDHGLQDAVKAVADDAAYSVLLFVVPALFPTWKQIWGLLRFTLIAFIPAGVYTIYQSVNGLSAFEIEYLKSGLTIMVKELDDVRPRPFSTLNSAHALSYVSSTLAVLSFIPMVAGPGETVAGRHRWRYAALGFFYLVVCTLTMARGGHIVWMVTIAGIVMFSSARRIVAFYGLAATIYLSLVVFSEWFLVKLPVWDAKLSKSSALMVQATRIQTYSDRLMGFRELKDWNNYTWFGTRHEVFSHDSLTSALFNYGVAPLAVILVIVFVSLTKIHRGVLKLAAGPERSVANLLLGAGFGVVTGAVLFGGVAGVFPVNAFMWITVGGLLVLIYQNMEDRYRAAEKARMERVAEIRGRSAIFKTERA